MAAALLGAPAAGAAPPPVQARFDLDAAGGQPVPRRLAHRSRPRPADRPPGGGIPPRPAFRRGRSATTCVSSPSWTASTSTRASRFASRGRSTSTSVSSRSVFLVRLAAGPPELTGVDRLVWDPATLTLYARPESLLEPETRYGLVVTRDLRDSAGRPVEPSPGFAAASPVGRRPPPGAGASRGLRRAPSRARASRHPGGPGRGRLRLHHGQRLGVPRAGPRRARPPPPAAALMTAPEAGGRAWFPRATLARLVLRRQVGRGRGAGRRRGTGRRRAARRIPGRHAAPRRAAAGRGRRRRDRVVLVTLVPDARAPDRRGADPRASPGAPDRPSPFRSSS